MDEITVHFKNRDIFFTTGVFSAVYIGDELIILYVGKYEGFETKIIDGTLIESYTVKNGKK
jgi:hypothetical protein